MNLFKVSMVTCQVILGSDQAKRVAINSCIYKKHGIPRKPGFPTAAAIKNGPGEIILAFKHETLSIDLLYNPTLVSLIYFRRLLRNRPEMKLKI